MAARQKHNANQANEKAQKQRTTRLVNQGPVVLTERVDLAMLQRAIADPSRASPANILALQRTAGNRAVTRLIQTKPIVGPAGDEYEQGADRAAEQVMRALAPYAQEEAAISEQSQGIRIRQICAACNEDLRRQPLDQEEGKEIQLKPDVGFTVHNLSPRTGNLDDPSFDRPGLVDFPLSFGVTSPIEVGQEDIDVEITGSPDDTCAGYEIGFLQTVAEEPMLYTYYFGQSIREHGGSLISYSAPLPIRDGARNSMWYGPASNERPAACGTHVHPTIDDYPTLWSIPKVRRNSVTRQPNYLRRIHRDIRFVTTLVASGPTGVQPLRHFPWRYHMDIRFQPNYEEPDAAWQFEWAANTATAETVQLGASGDVPLFTDASTPYNAAITANPPTEYAEVSESEASAPERPLPPQLEQAMRVIRSIPPPGPLNFEQTE